jgi:hypothetical protein
MPIVKVEDGVFQLKNSIGSTKNMRVVKIDSNFLPNSRIKEEIEKRETSLLKKKRIPLFFKKKEKTKCCKPNDIDKRYDMSRDNISIPEKSYFVSSQGFYIKFSS